MVYLLAVVVFLDYAVVMEKEQEPAKPQIEEFITEATDFSLSTRRAFMRQDYSGFTRGLNRYTRWNESVINFLTGDRKRFSSALTKWLAIRELPLAPKALAFLFTARIVVNSSNIQAKFEELQIVVKQKLDILQSLQQKSSETLYFDDTTHTLHFAGQAILISSRAQNDSLDLLRLLFTDRSRLWHNDEILNKWDIMRDKNAQKMKAYHAGKALNDIIAKQTTVQDFLLITTKTIRINPKYLMD